MVKVLVQCIFFGLMTISCQGDFSFLSIKHSTQLQLEIFRTIYIFSVLSTARLVERDLLFETRRDRNGRTRPDPRSRPTSFSLPTYCGRSQHRSGKESSGKCNRDSESKSAADEFGVSYFLFFKFMRFAGFSVLFYCEI